MEDGKVWLPPPQVLRSWYRLLNTSWELLTMEKSLVQVIELPQGASI